MIEINLTATVSGSSTTVDTPDVVQEIIAALAATDLKPGALVNGLFTRLVSVAGAVGGDHPAVRDAAVAGEARRLSATGEGHLESHWADRVRSDPACLARFPYLDNYRQLARAEYGALTEVSTRPVRHVVFAGCGPLPLTAVELNRIDPELQITCLDVDAAAAESARSVLDAVMGPQRHKITVERADAAARDYADADAVLLAALVGSTPTQKRGLIERIATRLSPGALLAVRSVPADGRQLLYPRLDPTDCGRSLDVLGEWLPPDGVINSLVMLRPAART